MKRYSNYVQRLERLLGNGSVVASDDPKGDCAAALDGEPSQELRRVISLKKRRGAGAFFTGSELARRAVPTRGGKRWRNASYFDPACGVGDLLLAAARRLAVRGSLAETVEAWGAKLMGCDIHPEFIRATKVRLALLARERGARLYGAQVDLKTAFPLIEAGDGLAERR